MPGPCIFASWIQKSQVKLHKEIKTSPGALMQAIRPCLDGLVIAVRRRMHLMRKRAELFSHIRQLTDFSNTL
ncbi:MAG: hypothetical protein ABIJ59_04685 [Pseudomonadota bacterium]